MKLDYFILGLLTIDPCTGYDIKKALDTGARLVRARAPLSQIYNTLKRMRKAKWVTFEEEARDGRPNAKVYHNTPLGEQVFLDFLHTPSEPAFRFRESDIFFRVWFAFMLETDVILAQLRNELAYRQEQVATFRPRDRTVYSSKLSAEHRASTQAIMNILHTNGARAIDDYIATLEELIAFFQAQKKST